MSKSRRGMQEERRRRRGGEDSRRWRKGGREWGGLLCRRLLSTFPLGWMTGQRQPARRREGGRARRRRRHRWITVR